MLLALDSKVVVPQIPKRTDSENKPTHARKEAPGRNVEGFTRHFVSNYLGAFIYPGCQRIGEGNLLRRE